MIIKKKQQLKIIIKLRRFEDELFFFNIVGVLCMCIEQEFYKVIKDCMVVIFFMGILNWGDQCFSNTLFLFKY